MKYTYLAIANKNNMGKPLTLGINQTISVDIYLQPMIYTSLKEFILNRTYYTLNKRFIRFNICKQHRDYKDIFYFI